MAGFAHEALFYAGEQEFLEGTAAFVREGLAAGEPVLVVVDARKIDRLRETLGRDAADVLFSDMTEVGSNPARIIPAWKRFVDHRAVGGRPVRGIGEPIWPERTAEELVECQRHESLLNLAFADAPAWRLLCPYDTERLDGDVLAEARQSHPTLVEGGGRTESASYRGLDAIAEPFAQPLPDPPASTEELAFGPGSIAETRRLISLRAAEAGLDSARMHNLVLAANEMATNSIRHGGGGGVLRIWRDNGTLICDIRDAGRIDAPLLGRELPGLEQQGGRGHWMANQLCDLVQVRSFADGSAVRLHMHVD
jgi:anti-sigma regulatory factor (Ser/Thr protein kinase)